MYLGLRDAQVIYVGWSLFEGLKELGVQSFELKLNRDLQTPAGYDLSNKDGMNRLIEDLERYNIVVNAVLVENDFAKTLNREVDYILKGMEIAWSLGCDVVRINGFMEPLTGYGEERVISTIVEGVEKVRRMAEYPVMLAVENHGEATNDINILRRILVETDEDFLGVTLDTGNFFFHGESNRELIHEIYREVAGRVLHTHMKNVRVANGNVKMAPLYEEGEVDFQYVIEVLLREGYERDITVEDESLGKLRPEERKEVLRRDVEFLRKIVKEV
ncbi:hypothetical protein DRN93_00550 [archaeon]|nr:MAG: hypothetical protein DRN93_00550 [archaeon]